MIFKHTMMAFMVAATVGLASCSDDNAPDMPNVNGNNAISFTTYTTNAQSRASMLDSEGLKEGFGVFALHYTADETASSNGWLYNYFANQQVVWDEDQGFWIYSPLKFWPESNTDKMTFMAYAPYHDLFSDVESEVINLASDKRGGQPILSYQVPQDVTKGVDLVYDNTKKDITKPDNGFLNFQFKHALSSLSFGVNALNVVEGEIVIEEVRITPKETTPFCTKAYFNLYSGDWDYTDEGYVSGLSWVWTGENFSKSALQGDADYADLNEDCYLMTIPDEITKQFEVAITYSHKVYDPNIGDDVSIRNVLKTETEFTPKMGKSYRWSFFITANTIAFEGTTSDWK